MSSFRKHTNSTKHRSGFTIKKYIFNNFPNKPNPFSKTNSTDIKSNSTTHETPKTKHRTALSRPPPHKLPTAHNNQTTPLCSDHPNPQNHNPTPLSAHCKLPVDRNGKLRSRLMPPSRRLPSHDKFDAANSVRGLTIRVRISNDLLI